MAKIRPIVSLLLATLVVWWPFIGRAEDDDFCTNNCSFDGNNSFYSDGSGVSWAPGPKNAVWDPNNQPGNAAAAAVKAHMPLPFSTATPAPGMKDADTAGRDAATNWNGTVPHDANAPQEGLDQSYDQGGTFGDVLPPTPPKTLVATGQGNTSSAPLPAPGAAPSVPGNDKTDPVASDGEFILTRTDLNYPGFSMPMVFKRTYRSGIDYDGVLGYGWDHNYDQKLFSDCTGVDYQTGSAGRLRFTLRDTYTDPNTKVVTAYFDPPPDIHIGLVRIDDQLAPDGVTPAPWRMVDEQGISYYFNNRDLLVAIQHPSKDLITIAWEYPLANITRGWRVTTVTGKNHVAPGVDRVMTYTYYPSTAPLGTANKLQSVSYANNKVSFSYSNTGDLASVADATGHGSNYFYDSGHAAVTTYLPDVQLDAACHQFCDFKPDRCQQVDPCSAAGASQIALDFCTTQCRDQKGCYANCDSACMNECGGESPEHSACINCVNNCQVDLGSLQSQCGRTLGDRTPIGNDPWHYNDNVNKACANECNVIADKKCPESCNASAAAGNLTGGGGFFSDLVSGLLITIGEGTLLTLTAIADTFVCIFSGDCHYDDVTSYWLMVCGETCSRCVQFGECFRQDGAPVSEGPDGNCRNKCVDDVEDACVKDASVVRVNQCFAQCETTADGNGNPSSCVFGCLPGKEGPCCSDQCNSSCTQLCNGDPSACQNWCQQSLAAAPTLPWQACHDGCVDSCNSHNQYHDHSGAHFFAFGRPQDLNHNLIEIHDGDGRVVLKNLYGTDPLFITFDKVVDQQMDPDNQSAHIKIDYHDLNLEAGLPNGNNNIVIDDMPSLPDPAHVVPLASFQSVEVCPRICVQSAPPVPLPPQQAQQSIPIPDPPFESPPLVVLQLLGDGLAGIQPQADSNDSFSPVNGIGWTVSGPNGQVVITPGAAPGAFSLSGDAAAIDALFAVGQQIEVVPVGDGQAVLRSVGASLSVGGAP